MEPHHGAHLYIVVTAALSGKSLSISGLPFIVDGGVFHKIPSITLSLFHAEYR